MKKLISVVFAISLILVSCGPKGLSDADFFAAAQSVCETLQTNSASLGKLDLISRGAAYTVASVDLAKLNITQRSAPQGSNLRAGISGLADSFNKLGTAINDAAAKANLKSPVTVMITDDGKFFGYTGNNLFDVTPLDVDPGILTELRSYQAQVQDAATKLNLEKCMITW